MYVSSLPIASSNQLARPAKSNITGSSEPVLEESQASVAWTYSKCPSDTQQQDYCAEKEISMTGLGPKQFF